MPEGVAEAAAESGAGKSGKEAGRGEAQVEKVAFQVKGGKGKGRSRDGDRGRSRDGDRDRNGYRVRNRAGGGNPGRDGGGNRALFRGRARSMGAILTSWLQRRQFRSHPLSRAEQLYPKKPKSNVVCRANKCYKKYGKTRWPISVKKHIINSGTKRKEFLPTMDKKKESVWLTPEDLVPASKLARSVGSFLDSAKERPLFITRGQEIDAVLIGLDD